MQRVSARIYAACKCAYILHGPTGKYRRWLRSHAPLSPSRVKRRAWSGGAAVATETPPTTPKTSPMSAGLGCGSKNALHASQSAAGALREVPDSTNVSEISSSPQQPRPRPSQDSPSVGFQRMESPGLTSLMLGGAVSGLYDVGMHEEEEEEQMTADLLACSRVFARCSPQHKQELVTSLATRLGLTVGFCGDGANDCGALKAAHVGLSLSNAEASIAAPFTATSHSIHAMLDLVREGRAALVSSVASFKFMATYSLIQLITVLRLFYTNATLTDGMFLWIDLFLVLPFVVTMSQTAAAKALARLRPQGRLVSPAVLASVVMHLLLAILIQVLVAKAAQKMASFDCDEYCYAEDLGSLSNQTAHTDDAAHATSDYLTVAGELSDVAGAAACWSGKGPIAQCCQSQPLGCITHPVHPKPKINSVSVESTSAFLVSQYQYLAVLVAFSSGAPYRLPAYSNRWLAANFIGAVIATTILTLVVGPGWGVLDPLVGAIQLVPFPDAHFSGRLLLIGFAGIGAACALESVIIHIDDLLAGEDTAADGASALGGARIRSSLVGAGGRVNFRTCASAILVTIANISRGLHMGQLWKIGVSACMLFGFLVAAIALALSESLAQSV